MDTSRILSELRAERDRIEKAINALEALDSLAKPTNVAVTHQPTTAKPKAGKRTMSASARRRISEAAKKRWAERKSAAQPQAIAKKTTPKTASRRRKRGITAAGRKRISEMMKKRWADRKKAAGKAA